MLKVPTKAHHRRSNANASVATRSDGNSTTHITVLLENADFLISIPSYQLAKLVSNIGTTSLLTISSPMDILLAKGA